MKMGQLARQIGKMTDEQRADLAAGMNGIATIEGRRLSLHNTCMLALQIPNASVVGGFQQWKRAGRMVMKGQHGAAIWIPLGIPKAETAAETAEGPVGFTLATVFDVAQTEDITESLTA